MTEAFNQYEYDRAQKKFGRPSKNNDNKDVASSSSVTTNATPIRPHQVIKTKESILSNNPNNNNGNNQYQNATSTAKNITTKLSDVTTNNNHSSSIVRSNVQQPKQQYNQANMNPMNHLQGQTNQQSQRSQTSTSTSNNIQSKKSSSSIKSLPIQQQRQNISVAKHNHVSPLVSSNPSNIQSSSHNHTAPSSTSTAITGSNAGDSSGGIPRFRQTPLSSSNLSKQSQQLFPNNPTSLYAQTHQQQQQQYRNVHPSLSSSIVTKSPSLGNGSNHTPSMYQNNMAGNRPLSTMSINNLGRPSTAGGRNSICNGNVNTNSVQNVYNSTNLLSSTTPALPIKGNENNANGKRVASTPLQQQGVKKPNVYNGSNNPYASKKG